VFSLEKNPPTGATIDPSSGKFVWTVSKYQGNIQDVPYKFDIEENKGYKINAKAYGEPLDFHKHNFKVEIKAPTFYEMEIRQDEGVFMRFLLDL